MRACLCVHGVSTTSPMASEIDEDSSLSFARERKKKKKGKGEEKKMSGRIILRALTYPTSENDKKRHSVSRVLFLIHGAELISEFEARATGLRDFLRDSDDSIRLFFLFSLVSPANRPETKRKENSARMRVRMRVPWVWMMSVGCVAFSTCRLDGFPFYLYLPDLRSLFFFFFT